MAYIIDLVEILSNSKFRSRGLRNSFEIITKD